mmetsp:Transcript_26179/g.74691  ORF Transcript_26179/g.74691 Transcript_26179/m.74691 type:complete len:203 (+) Transcript_26179:507-1115(+)
MGTPRLQDKVLCTRPCSSLALLISTSVAPSTSSSTIRLASQQPPRTQDPPCTARTSARPSGCPSSTSTGTIQWRWCALSSSPPSGVRTGGRIVSLTLSATGGSAITRATTQSSPSHCCIGRSSGTRGQRRSWPRGSSKMVTRQRTCSTRSRQGSGASTRKISRRRGRTSRDRHRIGCRPSGRACDPPTRSPRECPRVWTRAC